MLMTSPSPVRFRFFALLLDGFEHTLLLLGIFNRRDDTLECELELILGDALGLIRCPGLRELSIPLEIRSLELGEFVELAELNVKVGDLVFEIRCSSMRGLGFALRLLAPFAADHHDADSYRILRSVVAQIRVAISWLGGASRSTCRSKGGAVDAVEDDPELAS